MSCGMTPELFEKIAEMQREQDIKTKQETSSRLSRIEREEEARVRALEKVEATQQTLKAQNKFDWTGSYQHWDKWEDPEEVQARKEEELARANRSAPSPCNHDHSAERKLMDMTTQEKLDACDLFRKEGNNFFKEGQYHRASDRYRKALVYFEYVFEEPHEKAAVDGLRLKCLLNHGASQLKVQNYTEAHNSLHQVLRMDPDNVKAHFRRAVAFRAQDKFDEARSHILRAMELDPKSAVLRRENDRLRKKKAAYKRSTREMSIAMISGTSRDRDERGHEGNTIMKQADLNNDGFDDIVAQGSTSFVTSAELLGGSLNAAPSSSPTRIDPFEEKDALSDAADVVGLTVERSDRGSFWDE